ncbi:hypothetical protein SY86_00995 [Erwinia tracheiphila]|uniref:Uncharacterized protein n=1 Tax=Erwinia tracheiphila TaxID=65700 RepID=A0A0M2KLK3_9GAMM|nr:hypothetical protein AV903_02615 [Erwinia tracheiphila]KKF38123.1 hypothetical protein SY86_00995 [Erwinia tracheiphila]
MVISLPVELYCTNQNFFSGLLLYVSGVPLNPRSHKAILLPGCVRAHQRILALPYCFRHGKRLLLTVFSWLLSGVKAKPPSLKAVFYLSTVTFSKPTRALKLKFS